LSLMKRCWQQKSVDRPTAEAVVEELGQIQLGCTH